MKQKPDFLGVGAGKTGTTWLQSCLKEHPDVFMPGRELDYFSLQYNRGLDWYSSVFRDATEKSVGDFSPSYMVYPEALGRIYDWNPNVYLIFSFRNPIARAYSNYCMDLRRGEASEDVDREINTASHYVSEGLYYHHLTRFLGFFPRHQMLVLLYDDLTSDPGHYIAQVFEFLGVDASFEPSILNKRVHARKSRPRFQGVYNMLVRGANSIYRNSRLGSWLLDTTRERGYFNVVHKFNQGSGYPEMSSEHKKRLADYFREDTFALSKLLGRDLSGWLDT